jgi:hypothetical protein
MVRKKYRNDFRLSLSVIIRTGNQYKMDPYFVDHYYKIKLLKRGAKVASKGGMWQKESVTAG